MRRGRRRQIWRRQRSAPARLSYLQAVISHEQRCIFVHIPKTGGTSIEDVIWGSDHAARTPDMLWMGGKDPHYQHWVRGFGGLQHMRAEQVREIVGAQTYDSYYSFAFVRNPWDRAVSQYLYARQYEEMRQVYQFDEDTSFPGYLRVLLDGKRERNCHSFEQWRFIFGPDGNQLTDFVGRFESLQTDFAAVAHKIGTTIELPHTNRSADRGQLCEYYGDDGVARDMVEALYGEDIRRFGYSFPG